MLHLRFILYKIYQEICKGEGQLLEVSKIFLLPLSHLSKSMENLMAGSSLPPLFTDEDGSKESNEVATAG